jgi:chromate reductase, NAD(P)H dehydrogenase (quinone)
MRILAFAASMRQQSLNRRLIELAAETARSHGAEVDLARFGEFDMPLYNADLHDRQGIPPGAIHLARRLEQAEAFMIAAPEYNYSIAGVLKNAIDWVSRIRPMPWRGKSGYLMSASPSLAGGVRGLWQTRIPLEGCGSLLFPDMFALAAAHEAFTEDGRLRDGLQAERLNRELLGFVRLAEAVAPICARPPSPEARKRKEEIEAALEDETELQGGPTAGAIPALD